MATLVDAIEALSQLSFDGVTGNLNTLRGAHSQSHAGRMFAAFNSGANKGSGQTVSLWFRTGELACHAVVDWSSSDAASASIVEAASAAPSTGTPAKAYNNNRVAGVVSTIQDSAGVVGQASADATLTGGETIWKAVAGAGQAPVSREHDGNEYVLKPNTGYAFVVQSAANKETLYVLVKWYEI